MKVNTLQRKRERHQRICSFLLVIFEVITLCYHPVVFRKLFPGGFSF